MIQKQAVHALLLTNKMRLILICEVRLHVYDFIISSCRPGAEFGMDALRCFVFPMFLYFLR